MGLTKLLQLIQNPLRFRAPVDQGFDQWSSDGTAVLNDNPPPSTGNVCLGVWVKSGPVHKLEHPSWVYDNAGNLTGTAVIREQLTRDADENSYKGRFAVDVRDLSGNLLFHQAGTITVQHITVDF